MRIHHFEGIENFRDLGGYETPYGETSFGVVYRCGKLFDATKADLDHLAELGIKTVIDLRSADEQKNQPDATEGDSRFKTLHLSAPGNGRIAQNRDDMVESYLEMVEDPYMARKILRGIMHADKPCVLHCTAGKDRTGVFVTLLLAANGVQKEDLNGEYRLSMCHLERLRSNVPDFIPKIVLYPDVDLLLDVIKAFLDRYESLENYFEVIGLSEDEVNLLCNFLGKQEKSCGAVVFHGDKVLVEHMKKGHFSIPKGHVEKEDKDEEATAYREILEETGLKAKIDTSFRIEADYSPKPGRAKRVVFFIAEVESENVTVQEKEVQAIYFLSPADAMTALTHDSDKEILSQALKKRYPQYY